MKTLSIIIPAYNESATIGDLLVKINSVDLTPLGFSKEVLVVDDGSNDNTAAIASSHSNIICFTQVPNQGKGKAVRRGIIECSGDFILIQDADLEYNPNNYFELVAALSSQNNTAVYGSRILGQKRLPNASRLFPGKHPNQDIGPWFAGIVLSIWTALLYRKWITDTLTAYKLYPAKYLKSLKLETSGFETDHEITAKLINGGVNIIEIPVDYRPRSVNEGKKIKPRDGLIALRTLWRYRNFSRR
ncbi:glycosyltransferase family 2 protein [Synoicihabitans lomoniglobus]|uniref:Glycosyltransferase family 2 protein n=1 Tax=Synoicihabitans lomoniglobus TaxID=2909285 RepID=A0AAF0CSL9_9BACT|nr:glycosyltransferase family 2 protein [Opitutaceae bacterium LMO-M01]WED67373.1 glycosyltransferase family 2 protein [Opitutaceae bacterium LMO-M01]